MFHFSFFAFVQNRWVRSARSLALSRAFSERETNKQERVIKWILCLLAELGHNGETVKIEINFRLSHQSVFWVWCELSLIVDIFHVHMWVYTEMWKSQENLVQFDVMPKLCQLFLHYKENKNK